MQRSINLSSKALLVETMPTYSHVVVQAQGSCYIRMDAVCDPVNGFSLNENELYFIRLPFSAWGRPSPTNQARLIIYPFNITSAQGAPIGRM